MPFPEIKTHETEPITGQSNSLDVGQVTDLPAPDELIATQTNGEVALGAQEQPVGLTEAGAQDLIDSGAPFTPQELMDNRPDADGVTPLQIVGAGYYADHIQAEPTEYEGGFGNTLRIMEDAMNDLPVPTTTVPPTTTTVPTTTTTTEVEKSDIEPEEIMPPMTTIEVESSYAEEQTPNEESPYESR